MQNHSDLRLPRPLRNPVVAIGTFDGVHRGHLAILARVCAAAHELQGESVILTFHPHPRMVLYPEDHGLQLLNTREEKALLLEQAGIDHLVVYPFTENLARMTAAEYVRELLVNGLGVKKVIAGFDHRFGRNREGDFSTLLEMAETYGFEVEEIPAQVLDDVKVSSTKIREALLAGDVSLAREYLGYSYMLRGTVVRGEGKGREIGYPTANISTDDPLKLIPGHGVYAVRALVGNKEWQGAVNIGTRPTVSSSGKTTVEVHIPGLQHDLYGEIVTIRFEERIRGELKFGSIHELRDRIEQDIEWTKNYFSEQTDQP